MRIKMQSKSSLYSGSYNAFSTILSEHSLKGVYRGLGVTMMRDMISFAIFFGVYETLKQKYTKPNEPKNILLLMGIGGMASTILWTVCYPIDVIKTVYQSDSLSDPSYKSSVQTMKEIYRTEGLKGF
mmetsp:Transcript_18670/g.16535  ORF Transcript_18670/g.16535 Transcript_18670/m.16535 type:complete len:127 (-) Transcript_18670:108-488(-)